MALYQSRACGRVGTNGGEHQTMVDMDKGMDMAIGIFVVVLLGAALLPVAFDLIFNASTTAWDSNTVTIWELIPLVAVVGILLLFVNWAKGQT